MRLCLAWVFSTAAIEPRTHQAAHNRLLPTAGRSASAHVCRSDLAIPGGKQHGGRHMNSATTADLSASGRR
eukprot:5247216-Lingulodinium_polyedra.AAC.1